MKSRADLFGLCGFLLLFWAPAPLRAQSTAPGSAEAGPAATELVQIPVERVRLLETKELYGGAALSPDGRWLAYSTGTLHLLPMEDGLPAGNPVELAAPGTGGPIEGAWPQWPANDVVLFTGPKIYDAQPMYRVRIEPGQGRAVEAPRRVSLDPVFRGYGLSPSGDSVVYIAMESEQRTLKVMSSLGGPSQPIETTGRLVGFPRWDRDGRIYYHIEQKVTDASTQLFRVRLGGTLELVGEFGGYTYVDPDAGTLLYPLCFNRLIGMPACGPETRLATLNGQDLGTVEMEGGVVEGGTGGDLYVTTYLSEYPLRVVDLESGEEREVSAGPDWWLDDWLGDTRVAYWGGSPAGSHLWEFDLATGVTRDLGVPESSMRGSAIDGRWYLYGPRVPGSPRTEIRLRDLEAGTDRVLTNNGTWTAAGGLKPHIRGRGGYLRRDGRTLLYSTEQDGVQEIWAVEPESSPRRLWRLRPEQSFVPTAVRGDWLAFRSYGPNWQGDPEEPPRLLLAGPGMTEPQVLYEAPAGTNLSGGTWSRGGDRIAFNAGGAIRILDIDISGRSALVSLDPREYRLPQEPGEIYWDAEDQGLVVLAWATDDAPDVSPRNQVWHLDLTTGRTTQITSAEDGSIWEMRMSPDGRHIVYIMERSGGVELWRFRIGR